MPWVAKGDVAALGGQAQSHGAQDFVESWHDLLSRIPALATPTYWKED